MRQSLPIDESDRPGPTLGRIGLGEAGRRGSRLCPFGAVGHIGRATAKVAETVVGFGKAARQQFRARRFRVEALGAVIGHEQDYRVVEFAVRPQRTDHPADIGIHAFDHRGIDLHGARGFALFAG